MKRRKFIQGLITALASPLIPSAYAEPSSDNLSSVILQSIYEYQYFDNDVRFEIRQNMNEILKRYPNIHSHIVEFDDGNDPYQLDMTISYWELKEHKTIYCSLDGEYSSCMMKSIEEFE